MIIEEMRRYFCEREKERQWANPIRASNAGKCARAIAYQLHYPDKLTPLGWRARMTFRLGDLIEQDLKDALKSYESKYFDLFLPRNGEPQEECKLTIAGKEIIGHIDGRAVKKDDGTQWIVEFKSINDRGYQRVLKGDIGHSYECTACFYMKALDIPNELFIFYNKNTSANVEVACHFEPKTWNEVDTRFTSVINSTPDYLPEREYQPDKKGKLPWNCCHLYCSAFHLCYPEAETKFDVETNEIITAISHGKES